MSDSSGSSTPTHISTGAPMSDDKVQKALAAIALAESSAGEDLIECRNKMLNNNIIRSTHGDTLPCLPDTSFPEVNWAEDQVGEIAKGVDPINPADEGITPKEAMEEFKLGDELASEMQGYFADDGAGSIVPNPPVYNPEVFQERCPPEQHRPDPNSYATVKDLGTLYTVITDGLDKTLTELHDIRVVTSEINSSYKILKDHQINMMAQVQEVSQKLDLALSMQGAAQSELVQLKQELSVCSVGFSKINAGLTHLTSSGIPLGKLPEVSNFSPVVHNKSSVEIQLDKATPIPMPEEKLKTLLGKAGFDKALLDEYCNLLNNRVATYFAKVFPILFPGVIMSSPPAQELLKLGLINTSDKLQAAMKNLHELANLRSTAQHKQTTEEASGVTQPSTPKSAISTSVKKARQELGF